MSYRWSGELKRVDVDGAGHGRTGGVNVENVPPSMAVGREKSRTDVHQDTDKYMLPDINVLRNRFLKGYQAGSMENTSPSLHSQDKGLHLFNTKIGTTYTDAKSRSNVGHNSAGHSDGMQLDFDLDPETFFEVTNHSERFKYTRAKFAELEKQYLREQECHHVAFKKKAVRGMSLPLKMTLTTIDGTDIAAAKSPTATHGKGSMSSARTATPNSDYRGLSPSHGTRSSSLERPGVSTGGHVVKSIHISERSAPATRVERVVSVGDGSVSDDRGLVSEEVPDPKWLMKHFEEVSKSSGSSDLKKLVQPRRPLINDKHRSTYSHSSDGSRAATSHKSSSGPNSPSHGPTGIVITKTSSSSVSEKPAWRQQDSLKTDENSAIASLSTKSGFTSISKPHSSSSIGSVTGKGSSGSRTNSEVELRKKRWEFHEANKKSFDEVEGATVIASIEAWKSKRRSYNGRDSLVGLEDEARASPTVVESDALLLLRKPGSPDGEGLVSSSKMGSHSNHVDLKLPNKTFETKTVLGHDGSRSRKSSGSESDDSDRENRPRSLKLGETHQPPKDGRWTSQGSLKSPTVEVRSSSDFGSPDRSGSPKDDVLVSLGSLKSPNVKVSSGVDFESPDRSGSRNSVVEIGSKVAAVGLVSSSLFRETVPSATSVTSSEKRHSLRSSSEDEGVKNEKSIIITQPRDSLAAIRLKKEGSFEEVDHKQIKVDHNQINNDHHLINKAHAINGSLEVGQRSFDSSESDVIENDSYFYEVPGLSAEDPEADTYPEAKKPSRVKFSTSPMKVYSTYAVEDYDRRNDSIDPIAASAEYELEKRVEKMNIFEVEIDKASDGLGLSIIGMGVGADTGLEKLGIFIKTIAEGGAVGNDGRMRVNDQIIEVDGKYLVGVTQAYAASVLRGTSGRVRFLVGRESDPANSEVARLIKQSLEQDQFRAEMRVNQMMSDQNRGSSIDDIHELDSDMDERPPMPSFPPPGSPSSDLDSDPKMLTARLLLEQQKLTQLQEDLSAATATLVALRNGESTSDMDSEEVSGRLRGAEEALEQVLRDCSKYQAELAESKERYALLEKNLRLEVENMEKQYKETKDVIDNYQKREKDFFVERDELLQKQQNNEKQHKDAINSLEIRIAHLEKGLSVVKEQTTIPSRVSESITPKLSTSPLTKPSESPILQLSTSPVQLQASKEVELATKKMEIITVAEYPSSDNKVAASPNSSASSTCDFNSVPHTELLVSTASQDKRQLATSGALASRRPPSLSSRQKSREENGFGDAHNGNESDSEGSIGSQTSYSPNLPKWHNAKHEIPGLSDAAGPSGIVLLSHRQRSIDLHATTASKLRNGSSGDGVVLISKRPLPEDGDGNLINSTRLAVSLGNIHTKGADFGAKDVQDNEFQRESASVFSNSTFSLNDQNLTTSQESFESMTVLSWRPWQVAQWLIGHKLGAYSNLFMNQGIDGPQLVQLDNAKIKSLGITSTKDRDILKKKIKEIKVALDKDKKQQEKEQKAKEKLEKQALRKKSK